MSDRPVGIAWANDSSEDERDTSKLLGERQGSYQAVEKQILRDHEEGLDQLGVAIKRQKYMANEIANEVDLQNEMIDDIDEGMTTTNANLQKNTRNIKLVTKQSSTFFLWLVIIALGIIIILLAIV